MTRYLISFDDGSMDHITAEEFPDVVRESHEVVDAAKAAGVWVLGVGVEKQRATIVREDGSVTDGPFPETKAVVGGFCLIDVPSREEAHAWAARIAQGCRCDQEVREIMDDPDA
jgi:hypothetical protein